MTVNKIDFPIIDEFKYNTVVLVQLYYNIYI